jgi:hypothetical protein
MTQLMFEQVLPQSAVTERHKKFLELVNQSVVIDVLGKMLRERCQARDNLLEDIARLDYRGGVSQGYSAIRAEVHAFRVCNKLL